MSNSLVTSSLNPAGYVTTFTANTKHVKNETSSNPIKIGNLEEQGTVITVSNQGSVAQTAVSSTFTMQTGDVATLAQSFDNVVDQATDRYQILDSNGSVVADSAGTAAQQAVYQEWASSAGVSLPAGTYTAMVTPVDGNDASISTTQNQGTSLQVNSTLTGGDPNEYYSFSLGNGNNIKMAFDAGTQDASTRVQLLDSSGNIIADSGGNSYEKANFAALTSGNGLTASQGDYMVNVSYAANIDTTTASDIPYNFQLYSGSNYAVVYKSNVTAQPADNTAAGSVTANSQAKLYSRQDYNSINATAANGVNIGWLQQDTSALQVTSQLTSADSADYYDFTLQSGNNLKFGFNASNTPDASNLRVQLLDSSGMYVIADNQGTPEQQAAYKALTTTNGLSAKAGNYVVKVSYATNAPKKTENYQFGLYSGTTYKAMYTTTASAQTYANAMLTGSVGGSAASAGIAAYLNAASNGTSMDVFAALTAKI